MNPINTGFTCPVPELAENPQISSLIARCAQLAMLLEVSASPKPGNVDREHNYPDTCFEHFVASSVSVYPVIELAARSRHGIGALIRNAVCESSAWQKGGNTHFGAFLLLIPLSMAAGELFSSCEKAPYKLYRGNSKLLLHMHMLLSGQRTARMLSSSTGLSTWQVSGLTV